MMTMNADPDTRACTPAPLRPELAARFLSAMQAASAEEAGDELERCLRRLRPASVGDRRSSAWLERMRGAAVCRSSRHGGWAQFSRWSTAAALFVLCASGGVLMLNSSALATEPTGGLACRSVMEARTGGEVMWHEGQTALRSCDVLYEDSFVLDGDEGSTITVRVPVRTRVMIEEEVI